MHMIKKNLLHKYLKQLGKSVRRNMNIKQPRVIKRMKLKREIEAKTR